MSLKAHTLNGEVHAHSHGAAHAMEVPPNSRRLFCNGQVGARLDGVVPEDPVEQIQVIFERLDKILSAASMGFSDILRLTVYVTDKSIFEAFLKQRKATMGNHSPPAVLLIVDEVPRVGVKIEIEAVAAKSV